MKLKGGVPGLKKALRLILFISAGFAILWLAFRGIDPQGLWTALLSVNLTQLYIATGFVLLGVLLKAIRWFVLIQNDRQGLSLSNVYHATAIGLMGNHLLPAKIGEILSAHMLAKDEGFQTVTLLGTILLQRVLDLISVLMICACGLLIFPVHAEVMHVYWMGLAVALALCLGIGLLIRTEAMVRSLLGKFSGVSLARRVRILIRSFVRGVSAAKSPQRIGITWGASLLVWGSILVAIYFVIQAFDFGEPIATGNIFTILVFITISVMLPVPAGLGPVQAAAFWALRSGLGAIHLSGENLSEKIAAFAIILHAVLVMPEIICGLFSFLKKGNKLLRPR